MGKHSTATATAVYLPKVAAGAPPKALLLAGQPACSTKASARPRTTTTNNFPDGSEIVSKLSSYAQHLQNSNSHREFPAVDPPTGRAGPGSEDGRRLRGSSPVRGARRNSSAGPAGDPGDAAATGKITGSLDLTKIAGGTLRSTAADRLDTGFEHGRAVGGRLGPEFAATLTSQPGTLSYQGEFSGTLPAEGDSRGSLARQADMALSGRLTGELGLRQ
jgi:hypothetical protein